MTVLVLILTVVVAVLAVLVAGLLRAYGTVLRRLHELDAGAPRAGAREFRLDATSRPVAAPEPRAEWAAAHDVAGVSVAGEIVSTRLVGVEHDTVLAFLSTGCASCEVFWRELADPSTLRLPDGTRLLVVTQGPELESSGWLADLVPPGLDVLMSTEAWRDYEVPGSPHIVYVDGRTGRVRGEGTGQSWHQVAELLARSTGDAAFLTGGPSIAKPGRDAEQEAAVDRELMAAGILPGDPRLYGA